MIIQENTQIQIALTVDEGHLSIKIKLALSCSETKSEV